jgi:hypothetical protein
MDDVLTMIIELRAECAELRQTVADLAEMVRVMCEPKRRARPDEDAPADGWVSIKMAAHLSGHSPRWIFKLRDRGVVPWISTSRGIFVKLSAVMAAARPIGRDGRTDEDMPPSADEHRPSCPPPSRARR